MLVFQYFNTPNRLNNRLNIDIHDEVSLYCPELKEAQRNMSIYERKWKRIFLSKKFMQVYYRIIFILMNCKNTNSH